MEESKTEADISKTLTKDPAKSEVSSEIQCTAESLAESGEDIFDILPPEYRIRAREHDLDKEALDIADRIIKEQEPDKFEDLTKLFELNQSKKNVLRIIKLNNLFDTITDNAMDRISNPKNMVRYSDIIGSMKTTQDSIKASQDYVSNISSKPMIQINNQHNEIKIEGRDSLNQESKDKVINAVTDILASITKQEKEEKNINNIVEVEAKDMKENKKE